MNKRVNCGMQPKGAKKHIQNVLGIGLIMQIDVKLMVYLGVREQYVGGTAKPTSLP